MRDVMNYIAESTLEIEEGTFYDQWVFLWSGQFVRATVGGDTPQITILTDHLDSSLEEIQEFIEHTVRKLAIVAFDADMTYEGEYL